VAIAASRNDFVLVAHRETVVRSLQPQPKTRFSLHRRGGSIEKMAWQLPLLSISPPSGINRKSAIPAILGQAPIAETLRKKRRGLELVPRMTEVLRASVHKPRSLNRQEFPFQQLPKPSYCPTFQLRPKG
jgi:hypothetical protein